MKRGIHEEVKEANVRDQLSYTNSTEVLFAVVSFYQLRVMERLWGSRKFAVSFDLFLLPAKK